MRYYGDTSLPSSFQKRVTEVFGQTLVFARLGKTEEILLGCDFILRLDPHFEPARRLRKRTLGEAEEPGPEARVARRIVVEEPQSIEFRESPRVSLSTPYRVDVGKGWEYHLGSESVELAASDLSEGGMFVEVEEPQSEGSVVDFEVQFAGMRRIEGRGEVAWVRDSRSRNGHASGIGIRFLELRGDGPEMVRQTMESASAPATLDSAP